DVIVVLVIVVRVSGALITGIVRVSNIIEDVEVVQWHRHCALLIRLEVAFDIILASNKEGIARCGWQVSECLIDSQTTTNMRPLQLVSPNRRRCSELSCLHRITRISKVECLSSRRNNLHNQTDQYDTFALARSRDNILRSIPNSNRESKTTIDFLSLHWGPRFL